MTDEPTRATGGPESASEPNEVSGDVTAAGLGDAAGEPSEHAREESAVNGAAQTDSAQTDGEDPSAAGDRDEEEKELAAQADDEQAIGDDESAEESSEDEADVEPLETAEAEPDDEAKRNWYILKVQSNREESIREGLLRRVNIAGLQDYFGDVIVPTEMVSEFKGGKKRVTKRKLYPGYIVVNMEINDDTWFLVRDTPGVGDFTGSAGKPTPMQPHEVSRILVMESDESKEKGPRPKISFSSGDRVKISEGTFENFEGDVESIDEANGKVTVMINIFGRSTPVELEYWQIESV